MTEAERSRLEAIRETLGEWRPGGSNPPLHPAVQEVVNRRLTEAEVRRNRDLQAAAIDRGRALLATYEPKSDAQFADAAQDAIVDIMEALEFYGLDGPAALAAAASSWDNDRLHDTWSPPAP